MSMKSLIQKISARLAHSPPHVLRDVLDIIRQHQQAPSQEVVERVAIALTQWRNDCNLGKPRWNDLHWAVQAEYREQAKAAIAAMSQPIKGDASTRKDEERSNLPLRASPDDQREISLIESICDEFSLMMEKTGDQAEAMRSALTVYDGYLATKDTLDEILVTFDEEAAEKAYKGSTLNRGTVDSIIRAYLRNLEKRSVLAMKRATEPVSVDIDEIANLLNDNGVPVRTIDIVKFVLDAAEVKYV